MNAVAIDAEFASAVRTDHQPLAVDAITTELTEGAAKRNADARFDRNHRLRLHGGAHRVRPGSGQGRAKSPPGPRMTGGIDDWRLPLLGLATSPLRCFVGSAARGRGPLRRFAINLLRTCNWRRSQRAAGWSRCPEGRGRHPAGTRAIPDAPPAFRGPRSFDCRLGVDDP